MNKKPFRLLAIGHSYIVSMNRSVLRELAQEENIEVTVAAPSFFHGSLRRLPFEAEPALSKLEMKPLNCYLTQKMHFFFYSPGALKALDPSSYDHILIWEEPYILSGFQLSRWAYKSGASYSLYTTQSLVKKYPWPFSYFDRWSSDHCESWYGCGELVYQAMQERGWGTNKGRVVGLPVDLDRFQPMSEARKTALKNELGLSGTIIGYLGRLTEEKGFSVLLPALEKLPKNHPWSLFIMGSGELEGEIRQWAKSKGWSDRLQLRLLSHDEVPQYLPVCDLLVSPSQTRTFWKEQFGRMLVEAMACGVPVIGSDSGEIPYVIGEAGLVVPEQDVSAWTNSIQSLLESPQLRGELAQKGFARCKSFSTRSLAEEWNEHLVKPSDGSEEPSL